jgi:hypothetical protein
MQQERNQVLLLQLNTIIKPCLEIKSNQSNILLNTVLL